MLPATLLKVKRKFLIVEISILYAATEGEWEDSISPGLPPRVSVLFFQSRVCSRLAAVPGSDLMKIAGFLLLVSGLFLVLSALALLHEPSPQALFVLLGVAVELLGLVMVFRSHLPWKERR